MRESSARLIKRINLAVIAISAWALVNPAFANELAYERVIDLEGTSNTRDIGGYQTSDLRTVRWGQIIRSEKLSRLTASDFQKLEEIGVKTVIDLRTDREHKHSPTRWRGDNPPQFFHFPIGDANNSWFQAQRRMMKLNRFTEEQSLEHMKEGYRMIAEDGLHSYQKLMDLVLDQSNWPILIHCNAGKDRSGIAVALILEALGVDRDTIMEEYLLTNEIGRSQAKAELLSRVSKDSRSGLRRNRGPSASAWLPLVGVQSEMLETFYASVDEQYGSMEALLAELGVDQEARSALIESLTTQQPQLAMGE
jgi:protein-tyrosine phosphatase